MKFDRFYNMYNSYQIHFLMLKLKLVTPLKNLFKEKESKLYMRIYSLNYKNIISDL